jgi:hypothetical protein
VGFPQLPGCRQVADPNDPPEVQYAETHDPTANSGGLPSWLPGLHVPLMQRYLFNIHQVLPVLYENLPKPGVPLGTGGKYVNGMRILRDLFFQLYYSSPYGYRRADFHNYGSGWYNNLSVLSKLVRMGLLREAARNARGWDPDDPAVADFFDALIDGAASVENPGDPRNPKYRAKPLIDALVDPKLDSNPRNPRHDLLWGVMKGVFGVIDAAEGTGLDEAHRKEIEGKPADEVARIRAEWAREFLRMKQLGYYTFAAAGPMKLTDSVLKTAAPLLREYSAYFAKHSDVVQDLLRSADSSYLTRALYEDQDLETKARFASVLRDAFDQPRNALDAMSLAKAIDDDAGAKSSLDHMKERWDALALTQQYKDLKLEESGRQALEFFEELDSDPAARSTAARLRTYLAERLEQGDLDQLFGLASRNPDGLHRVLETASHHVEDGELKTFFARARRALQEPAAQR